MSLQGTPLLLVTIALAAGSPVGCLLLWSRIRGPRAVRAGQRLGMVALAQVTALLVVGVLVNRYGGFYSSWSELFGTMGPVSAESYHLGADPAAVPIARSGRAAAAASTATWAPRLPDMKSATSWSRPEQWPQRGAVVSMMMRGRRSGLSEPLLVYLPPSYFGAQATRRLPVTEVFTGYPGTPAQLISKLHYPDRLLAGLASGETTPMVMVMMRPDVLAPWDTECTDVPGGPASFTFLSSDVPDAVSSRFGLTPSSYGAIGFSTGGYCAAKLALMAPEKFRAAASLSGYFEPATDFTTRGVFKGRTALRNENDLGWRLANLPMPATSIYLATSADEVGRSGYAVQKQFESLVRAPLSVDVRVLDHGGHNFGTWNSEIPGALAWLSHHLTHA